MHRPWLTTRVFERNDYINAVFLPVSNRGTICIVFSFKGNCTCTKNIQLAFSNQFCLWCNFRDSVFIFSVYISTFLFPGYHMQHYLSGVSEINIFVRVFYC